MTENQHEKRFVLCIDNEEYPASLELRKVYECVLDSQAESLGQLRVVDESGEDYLYPQEMFIPLEIPAQALEAFSHE
jgi:hypothetical protein